MSDDRLVLLSVHAHPDDESSKGAPTVARYHDEGVETVLVCCTGGEEGEILNPAMDDDETRANLPAVRMGELEDARKIIGYDHVELLGYRDSGMAGTPPNERPDCFARATSEEAVGKLVALIRKYKPNVIITYGDDQEFYPHPDHLRVHDVTVDAFAAAGDSSTYPELGEPWAPQKLYYSVLAYDRIKRMAEAFEKANLEFPFADRWEQIPDNDHRITTRLDVVKWAAKRKNALLAHRTQIDPESPFWFGLSEEAENEVYNEEDYILARSIVGTPTEVETDLFAGIRGRS